MKTPKGSKKSVAEHLTGIPLSDMDKKSDLRVDISPVFPGRDNCPYPVALHKLWSYIWGRNLDTNAKGEWVDGFTPNEELAKILKTKSFVQTDRFPILLRKNAVKENK